MELIVTMQAVTTPNPSSLIQIKCGKMGGIEYSLFWNNEHALM